jgi:pimeloyl-ACP methyl ester carboxylesterase
VTLRRRVAAVIIAFTVFTGVFVALPYLDAIGFIVRAADLPGTPATLAAWRTKRFTKDAQTAIPTRAGAVPARFYRPTRGFSRTVLLIPGVHRDGIDEARLVGLAEDLAATGYGVLTVAAPDLRRYRVTPQVTDVIEDAVAWAANQRDLAGDGRVGVIGVSFSGGLSIVAAGRGAIRDKVAFVMSFGGHGNLARVLHYLCTGQVAGDVEKSKHSSAVLGADHVSIHPPHDYGVAVTLLSLADRVAPADQVAALSTGIDGFLLASSLAMTDTEAANREFARWKEYASTLPEPSRTLMTYVNDRAVDKLGPILAPFADALADNPAMPYLSAERAEPPKAPIFLLHGVDDNVIPSIETVLLAQYLQSKHVEVHGLLSGLITHAEVNKTPGPTEVWRLASFWRGLMSY